MPCLGGCGVGGLNRLCEVAWVRSRLPGVTVSVVHELLANALVMTGEKDRTTDLRGQSLEGKTVDETL